MSHCGATDCSSRRTLQPIIRHESFGEVLSCCYVGQVDQPVDGIQIGTKQEASVSGGISRIGRSLGVAALELDGGVAVGGGGRGVIRLAL